MSDFNGVTFTLSGVGLAAGATGVETLLTLNLFNGNLGTVTPGSSFAIPAGKIFRITEITVASKGNATATAQTTVFSLRVNPSGAVVVSSAAVAQWRSATPASANAYDRFPVPLEDPIEIVGGSGAMQIGITSNSVFVTNPPTLDVSLIGFLY